MKGALRASSRAIWIVVGLAALVLGFIGMFLPILPTTPLILLAAFAFGNSSERLHNWLVSHNVFGPLIANWRRYGAISRSTKLVSVVSMVAVVLVSVLLGVATWIIVVQVLILSASGLFVVTRPLPPE